MINGCQSSPVQPASARTVALHVAFTRSSLAALLLVLTLGLPLAQIAHQASHHYQTLGAGDHPAPGGQQSRTVDDGDEAGCALCQLLNARSDAAAMTDGLPAIAAVPLVAICLHVSPRGITPASPTIAFARGPPRVS